jgi:hypothetical protein
LHKFFIAAAVSVVVVAAAFIKNLKKKWRIDVGYL